DDAAEYEGEEEDRGQVENDDEDKQNEIQEENEDSEREEGDEGEDAEEQREAAIRNGREALTNGLKEVEKFIVHQTPGIERCIETEEMVNDVPTKFLQTQGINLERKSQSERKRVASSIVYRAYGPSIKTWIMVYVV
ncbi:hypothetical protein TELCIR_19551, partial [Teladorsagia circumcincta]